MMFFLSVNISSNCFNMTFTYTYCPKIILPGEFLECQFMFVDPERRFSFYELCNFTNGLLSAKRNQTMNMFLMTIDNI